MLRTPRIETTKEIEGVILAAASGDGAFKDAKCLVIDSLSKMSKILLQDIVARKHAAKPRRGGLDQIEKSDYGDLIKAMERYVDLLVDLDMHIIFISLEKETRSDDDGPVTGITLGMPGQLPKKIAAAVDNVFALAKVPAQGETKDSPAEEAYVAMMTEQVGIQFARTRNEEFRKALGGGIINPTLPKIWEIYQGALEDGHKKVAE